VNLTHNQSLSVSNKVFQPGSLNGEVLHVTCVSLLTGDSMRCALVVSAVEF